MVVRSAKSAVVVVRSVDGDVEERGEKKLGCFADAGEGNNKSVSDKLSHVLAVGNMQEGMQWEWKRPARETEVGEVMVVSRQEAEGGVVGRSLFSCSLS